MKYRTFYAGKLDARILDTLDEDYQRRMRLLIRKTEEASWTAGQRNRQRKSILSNIALYQTLTEKGIPKQQAKELVQEYSFHIAGKAHKVLQTLFYIPGFFTLFRFFMRKGMAGEEIWRSKILSDTADTFSMDVHKCLWADTCSFFGCPEICEIFCLCDHIVFGNIRKLVFTRNQTLGMGGEKCDFCFRSKE